MEAKLPRVLCSCVLRCLSLCASLQNHDQPSWSVRALHQDFFNVGSAARAADEAGEGVLLKLTLFGSVAQRSLQIRNELGRACDHDVTRRYYRRASSTTCSGYKERSGLCDERFYQRDCRL